MKGAAVFAFCLAAVLWARPAAADFHFRADCADFARPPLEKTTVLLSGAGARAEVSAEVASTAKDKALGLMCRRNLPDGNGMLFLFDTPVSGGFWMFNTYIDLDILYIGEDGKVVRAVRMKKCPRAAFESRPKWERRCHAESKKYVPGAKYTATLELPAGYLKRKGFSPEQPLTAKWRTR